MRKTINPQPNLREPWLELEHARELETISSLLDAHPKLNELVLQDLRSVTPPAGSDVGRGGMSAEQVLRALLVKQLNQFTYRELAFQTWQTLEAYRTFCQLGIIRVETFIRLQTPSFFMTVFGFSLEARELLGTTRSSEREG